MEIVYTMDTKVKIKNENGTSKRPVCSCGSWISHWKNFSYEDVEKCSVDGCNNKAEAVIIKQNMEHISQDQMHKMKLIKQHLILSQCALLAMDKMVKHLQQKIIQHLYGQMFQKLVDRSKK